MIYFAASAHSFVEETTKLLLLLRLHTLRRDEFVRSILCFKKKTTIVWRYYNVWIETFRSKSICKRISETKTERCIQQFVSTSFDICTLLRAKLIACDINDSHRCEILSYVAFIWKLVDARFVACAIIWFVQILSLRRTIYFVLTSSMLIVFCMLHLYARYRCEILLFDSQMTELTSSSNDLKLSSFVQIDSQ